MKTVIDGLNINYEYIDRGTDTLCVVLHGWGCNYEMYRGIINTLQAGYSVLAPDFPGHGRSDEPAEPWDSSCFAQFTVKLIEKVAPDVKKVILLGHSNGGRTIIKLLTTCSYSFKVPKIVLIDSAGIKPVKTKKQLRRQRLYKSGKAVLSFGPIKAVFPKALDRWRKRFGSADYNSATPVMRDTLVRLVNEDLSDKLPEIKASCLLIWGDQDTATPISDARKMEELIPDAGLVTVTGADHFSFLRQPVLVHNVLKSFLKIG